ncbi:hypothetical protein KV203_05005 [Skermania piniformis]|uniref:ATP synthase I n=2 Tax=Skermania pinensis TaxID=39122 RepID=A0ABX8SA64_9ACTN|nr:hypothetical protein [Skermania piniformis]QXQ14754.1 hypothetical protein KV203_05005 [Skermania piniformis]
MTMPADPMTGQDSSEGFVVPALSVSLRLPAILVAVFGVLALAATGALDRLLLGVFICLGLLLGLGNAKLMQHSAVVITSADHPSKGKMALSSAARLAIVTVIALALAFLLKPNGIGVFFGLALFQVILVLNTTLPALKGLREQS